MTDEQSVAPGWPGIGARWSSSAKSGVGTSLNPASRVWFTISHGILNEIYFPRVDRACTRDMGFMVTDGQTFFSEEKRDANSVEKCQDDGVPAYHLVNTCKQGRYRIEKNIIADPKRDVILQRVRFEPLKEKAGDCRLYAMLAPHLGNCGMGNTGWVGDYKGHPMLFAERDGIALALACSQPWKARSAGFVGFSDGWQDLSQHKQMTWQYEHAENGNIALTGEIDWQAGNGEFVLAIGFGQNTNEAAERVVASLNDGFDDARTQYTAEWRQWLGILKLGTKSLGVVENLDRVSSMVLCAHESKRFPGGIIASLSIPWGMSKGDDDLGGYHLVWPRDLVETAGGLLAVGAADDAVRVAEYLQATQEADGHWGQNMWLDGSAYWGGVQMDETALPILLVDLLRRECGWQQTQLNRFWPMVRKAAAFVVCNGPVTQQDRWEEDPGYTPFTIAAEIAALLAAAELADLQRESGIAQYLRETADVWNDSIERWIYTTGTDLAKQAGVEGHYVRVAPKEVADSCSPNQGFVPIKNRPPGESSVASVEMVSPDALALVRFGLRSADDRRIVNTVCVIDSLLKKDTPAGPAWYRYNGDGYGEQKNGSPFDGTGIGRLWPLLTGERAHYELAAGRIKDAEKLRRTFDQFAGPGGMLPEQVWDTNDIAERELFFGKSSGSARPLVWAHAEYLKLLRSLTDGTVFDMPPQTVQRYLNEKHTSPLAVWRFNNKCRSIPKAKNLRLEATSPFVAHWSCDGWTQTNNTTSSDSGLGIHYTDLPTAKMDTAKEVVFTFHWNAANRWEGKNYAVQFID